MDFRILTLNKKMFYFSLGLGIFCGLVGFSIFINDEYIQASNRLPTAIVFAILGFVIGFLFISRKIREYRDKKFREPKTIPRRPFTEEQKTIARKRQNGICLRCKQFPSVWEYHHRDGNRSNDSTSNCEAICPTCHAKLERGLE